MFRLLKSRTSFGAIVASTLIGTLGAAHQSAAQSAQNPHPVNDTTPVAIGSYSTPLLHGWHREIGRWDSISAAYYRTTVGGTPLMAKVVQMRCPKAVDSPMALRQEKLQIEKDMKLGDVVTGEHSRLLTSRIIQYRGEPAIFFIRRVHGTQGVTQVKSLIFNEGSSQYQITMYVHSLMPQALRVANAGWQQLTRGIQRRA